MLKVDAMEVKGNNMQPPLPEQDNSKIEKAYDRQLKYAMATTYPVKQDKINELPSNDHCYDYVTEYHASSVDLYDDILGLEVILNKNMTLNCAYGKLTETRKD